MPSYNPIGPRRAYRKRPVLTEQMLLEDLVRVAKELGRDSISEVDYDRLGRFSVPTYCRRFRTWSKALTRVNLYPARHLNVTAEVLLEDICRVAKKLKTHHLLLDQYLTHGRFSRAVIVRHFELWYRAVEAAGLQPFAHVEFQKKGTRIASVKLRYDILKRDKFRCKLCGRSPSTHPELHLEIDHILPWCRGGRTEADNLRTLCQQCNRGKKDTIEAGSDEPRTK